MRVGFLGLLPTGREILREGAFLGGQKAVPELLGNLPDRQVHPGIRGSFPAAAKTQVAEVLQKSLVAGAYLWWADPAERQHLPCPRVAAGQRKRVLEADN